MKLKIGLALVILSLLGVDDAEARWVTREVCSEGTVTGGGGSNTNRDCWLETVWETEEMIGDPSGGWGGGPVGGWTPTYSAYYTDAHSCSMSDQERQEMASDAVRPDVLQEKQQTGEVADRRLEIRGYGGSREVFEIIGGSYAGALGNASLTYGYGFVRLVQGSCQSGTTGG